MTFSSDGILPVARPRRPKYGSATSRQLGLLCPIQTVNRMGNRELRSGFFFWAADGVFIHSRSCNRVMPRMPDPCPYCKGQTRAVLKMDRSNPKAKGRKVWFCAIHQSTPLGAYASGPSRPPARRSTPSRSIPRPPAPRSTKRKTSRGTRRTWRRS